MSKGLRSLEDSTAQVVEAAASQALDANQRRWPISATKQSRCRLLQNTVRFENLHSFESKSPMLDCGKFRASSHMKRGRG